MLVSDFIVKVDGKTVPFTISPLENIISNLIHYYDVIGWDQWNFLNDHEFVIFNTSLTSNQEMVLEINANWTMGTRFSYLYLSYCAGTARAWKGNTIEQVRFDVHQINYREAYEFFPQESITESDSNFECSALWNIDFESFPNNHVGIRIKQTREGIGALNYLIILSLVGIGVILLIARF